MRSCISVSYRLTKFKTVSYPGGAGPQKWAILSGEAEGAVTSLGDFANLLEDDTVIGLAEFSSTANPTYPEVPMATDMGVDLQIGSFIVMATPAGTPDDVVAKIETAYQAAYDSAEFQEWVANVGVTLDWLGGDDVTAWAGRDPDRVVRPDECAGRGGCPVQVTGPIVSCTSGPPPDVPLFPWRRT